MKRILLVNEFSGLNTGYSVYGRNLLTKLHGMRKYEIAELACYLDERDPRKNQFPWRVYPSVPSDENKELRQAYESNELNKFGALLFEKVCLDFKPDVLLSIKDVWMDRFMLESPLRQHYRMLWMPTVDGLPQEAEWLSLYKQADGLLTYTDWSKKVLEDYGLRPYASSPTTAESCLCPLNKVELKKSIGMSDLKIVGMVSRNQARKQFPDLMRAFRKFLDVSGRKDVLLYLHTSNRDLGWDIPELIKENGLSSKVLFTYVCKCGFTFPSFYQDENVKCKHCGQYTANCSNVQVGVPTEGLSRIYNMMDLYVQWASSEGMGHGSMEAAACGVPVISVDYTAMSDVTRKVNGEVIEPLGFQKEVTTKRNMAVPDGDVLAEKMVEFFNLPTMYQKLKANDARLGYEANYGNWDRTAQIWSSLIDQMPPALPWNSPLRIHNIVRPPESLNNVSNPDFVKYCITQVLGEQDKLNTYFHLKILRDLNYGYIPANPIRIPFGRNELFNMCANMCIRRNQWEEQRGKLC